MNAQTPTPPGINVQTVEDYNHLCDLLEKQAEHMKAADKYKRLAKVEWAKFFDCKKKINEYKGKLGIPKNDKLTITKELASEFNEL